LEVSDFHPVHECTMPIRWGDMDAFGHVNNTNYFRYMEQARIEWLESLGLASVGEAGTGPVIVNAHMTFLKQLQYPGDIVCRTLVGTVGRSSVETRFELRRADDEATLVAEGGAKVVWVSYATGRSTPMPDVLREHITFDADGQDGAARVERAA
jgi:acyl-CoA thioester hydrolase